jgi:archaemetzincin
VRLVCLAPVGTPDEGVVTLLAEKLPGALGLPVKRIAPLQEPTGSFDPGRGQWASADYLRLLLGSVPEGASRLLGITERDLFVPVLSFVFGQAQLGGTVAVVSLARLDPSFQGLPPDQELTGARALKEAVHELGHTLGLVHCPDPACPMSLSIDIRRLDAKTARPCVGCASLLKESPEMNREQVKDAPRKGAGR